METLWLNCRKRIVLRTMLSEKAEFSVQVLEDNYRLTRFYTGMPTYDSFLALADYLEPKVKGMRSWKGNSTSTEEKQLGPQCFSSLSVVNQLLAVLIRLRLALPITDISTRFKIAEATYSRMFTTWICLLSKELRLIFPFPSRAQVSQWMPRRFKKHFPSTRVIMDCYETAIGTSELISHIFPLQKPKYLESADWMYSIWTGELCFKCLGWQNFRP